MNTASEIPRAAQFVVQTCAVVVGGGALAAAGGWLVGHWSFTALETGRMPMAPSTAWLLVLLSTALWLHSRDPQRRLSRLFGGAAIVFTSAVSLLVIGHEPGWVPLEFEAWLFSTTATVGDIPVGRMSLHTAITLLCAASAQRCLLDACDRPRWWRPSALALAAVVSGSGAVTILGYAAGVPLLYGSGYVPMALSTAIALAVLGAGLTVAAYPDNWLLQGLTGASADTVDPQGRLFRWALVAVFLVLLAAISTVGSLYLRRQQADWRRKAEQELSAIADLRAAQLAEWLRERSANANLIRLTPYAARRALDVLDQPNSATTREMFTSWLERLLAVGPYDYALLLDAKRNVGLTYPKRASSLLSKATSEAAEQAFRTRQIAMSDLYWETEGGQVYLSVVVPLVVRREGTREAVPAAGVSPSPEDRSAAVLILQLRADRTLYRFVKTWPTPSPTGETLLMQREGDDVVYLSEFRHRPNLAPRLRTPLSREDSLVVRAARGEQGVLEGRDYREIPVLATTRAIRGTPWFLVAKVDQAEIYTPLREWAWTIISTMIVLALGVALSLHLLGRQRDTAFMQQLLQAKEAAEAANRAKGEFLANMSHEIRTPMTAILGLSELLTTSAHSPQEQREFLGIIRNNGEALLTLINDILDLARIESDRLILEKVEYSLPQLLQDLLSVVSLRANEKGLSLELVKQLPLPERICTDPARLRQILVNLLANAVKFTERGRVCLTVRSQAAADGATRLQFAVADTGIGIPAEKFGELFQPFMQADASHTRRYGGTGLGLAISKRLATALGGDIEVISELGQGSTFTLSIDPGPLEGVRPLEESEELALPPPPCAAPATGDPLVLQGRVLLAEDAVDNQRLIALLLRRAGAEVTVVENGQLAVAAAWAAHEAGAPFSVILMDMQMPELDGFEATRQLRERGYTAPIVALTAHAMAGDCQKCLAAGCNDYAAKPIDRQKLLASVAPWAARVPRPDAASAVSRQTTHSQLPTLTFSDLDCTDDPELGELIDLFVREMPERIKALEVQAKSRDWNALAKSAHTLKGAAGTYGFAVLTPYAARLEAAVRETQPDEQILAAVEELLGLCGCMRARRPDPGQHNEG